MGSRAFDVIAEVIVLILFLLLLEPVSLLQAGIEDSEEKEIEMSQLRRRSGALERINPQSKVSSEERQVLFRCFKNGCRSGVFGRETFQVIYRSFMPQGDTNTYHCHFLFEAFENDFLGKIQLQNFLKVLEVLARATRQEKLQWKFHTYRVNKKDGYLSKEELLDIMKIVGDLEKKCTYKVRVQDQPGQHGETSLQKHTKNTDSLRKMDEDIETDQKDNNIINAMWIFSHVI
uniref:Kv channel-interacting protein 4 n=1 Tax=Callithrix jacchus TaxID=9483 RepID=A0A8I3WUA2_CALJA